MNLMMDNGYSEWMDGEMRRIERYIEGRIAQHLARETGLPIITATQQQPPSEEDEYLDRLGICDERG